MGKFHLDPTDILNEQEGRRAPFSPLPGTSRNHPYYNPVLNFLYFPELAGIQELELASRMETGHWAPPTQPSRCFLRTIVALIHTEFYRIDKNEGFNSSSILPGNNPLNWLSKEVFKTVDGNLALLQEIRATDDAYSTIHMAGEPQKAREIQDKAIAKLKDKFHGFEEIYSRYMETADLGITPASPREALMWFASRGPGYLPALPLTKDGHLDRSEITKGTAKEALEDFQNHYEELPYSPKERLRTGIDLIEEMAKGGNSTFDNQAELLYELEERAGLEYPYRNTERLCNLCPLEYLRQRGIELLRVRGESLLTRNCPLSDLFTQGDLVPWDFVIMKILGKTVPQRLPSYHTDWPETAAFAALEYIRHYVLYSSNQKQFNEVALVDRVPPTEKEILKKLGGDDNFITIQNKCVHRILPFLSVKLEESQSELPPMDMVFFDN